jgi:uncharacterized protein (TIGR02679 family)
LSRPLCGRAFREPPSGAYDAPVGTSVPAVHVGLDPAKVRRMLGSPELGWLVERIRSRLERGEPIDGTLTLVGASVAQRRAAARLLGHSASRGSLLSVSLPAVAEELWRASAAPNLVAAVEVLGGPVRNIAAERAGDLQRWTDALAAARASPLAKHDWYAGWLKSISRDGTVGRVIRQGRPDVISHAAALLEHLSEYDAPPAPGDQSVVGRYRSEAATVTLSSLAATVLQDANALADSLLAGLVLRGLAEREGVQPPADHEAEQALWNVAGVVTDDLASQVLVLNVKAGGEPLGRWLTEAAETGQPFRVTLRQLASAPLLPWAIDVFVCASPALLRAAADELGPASPALVCTEGEPSVACMQLLQAAASSGSIVHWHSDFSWSGLRSTTIAVRRLKAQPWLMGAADYAEALAAGATDPLLGGTEDSPWDPRLAEIMRMSGRAVSEERVVARVLAGLRDAS